MKPFRAYLSLVPVGVNDSARDSHRRIVAAVRVLCRDRLSKLKRPKP
jgi:hypothetical protein